MKLAFMGNKDLAGQTFDLSDMSADMSYYREIGIGASKNINPEAPYRGQGKASLRVGDRIIPELCNEPDRE